MEEKTYLEQLGERLTELEKQLTSECIISGQKDLADKLEISIRTWRSYLRGEREPGVLVINTLCIVYHISHNWLVTGEGYMFTKPFLDRSDDRRDSVIKDRRS